jgi:hypothetical protein
MPSPTSMSARIHEPTLPEFTGEAIIREFKAPTRKGSPQGMAVPNQRAMSQREQHG